MNRRTAKLLRKAAKVIGPHADYRASRYSGLKARWNGTPRTERGRERRRLQRLLGEEDDG